MMAANALARLRAVQGATAIEHDLLTSPVRVYSPTVTTPGANTTSSVLLESGREAFHKTFVGVNRTLAYAYGQGALRRSMNAARGDWQSRSARRTRSWSRRPCSAISTERMGLSLTGGTGRRVRRPPSRRRWRNGSRRPSSTA